MIKIVSVEQTRKIEAAADANGLSFATMMENAGRAAAQRAIEMIADLDAPKVTLLIGAGNNGGDGLVTGRTIAEERKDALVRFYLLKRREQDDTNFKQIQDAGLFVAYAEDDHDNRVLRNMVASADLVIDALFGIGVHLPIKDDALKVLRGANQAINDRRAAQSEERIIEPLKPDAKSIAGLPRILAIDCPSGLDCDTGELDKNAIPADETMTFIAAKTGLLTFPGAQAVGRLSIATIGIPENLPELKAIQHTIADSEQIKSLLPSRALDSNKGSFGKALIVAGSVNYSGAPALAAKAAYRAGAGLVTVGAPGQVINTLAAQLMEPTWLMLPQDMGVLSEKAAPLIFEQLEGYNALLLGPGWGQEETTGHLLEALLKNSTTSPKNKAKRNLGFGVLKTDADNERQENTPHLPPLVIDADGLNLLAKIDEWWKLLPEGTIITPHPGEMGRLADLETSAVQTNRWQIAQSKAAEWQVVLL
ncbi:MAG: bifunctional ADP-dependent NAD(P)H-hydrate dehydratase/NAD(P)H-hydrate epimerase, partial [Chitinophagaceae bacterium]|nr:bifunctional ADP-dependent NAD(P)H-hydrate dehydratase/NAD(P)H-hydrate epimerase [Anaerolineae bacterium]